MNYTLYIDETITPNGKRHWQVKGQKTGGCLCVCVCGGGGGGCKRYQIYSKNPDTGLCKKRQPQIRPSALIWVYTFW